MTITTTEWVFEHDGPDWIGRNVRTGRRTALKGSLEYAQLDVRAGRYVCARWPECDHYGPEGCMRAIAEQQRRMRRAA